MRFRTPYLTFCSLVVIPSGLLMLFHVENHALRELHGWIGLLMAIGVLIHVLQHLRAIQGTLKKPVLYLALLPVLLGVTIVLHVGGASERGEVSQRRVMRQVQGAKLRVLSELFGKNHGEVLARMRGQGIAVEDSGQTLEELGERNGTQASRLLRYFVE
jgi:hypothetical protein